MKSSTDSDLVTALKECKTAFVSAAGFSMIINILMLVPSLYMLQVYDRVVPTGNKSTLMMLTLIVFVLFLTMSLIEWVFGFAKISILYARAPFTGCHENGVAEST